MSDPLAFFITFRTYGTWLHGDERGSFFRPHRAQSDEPLPPNAIREGWERSQMKQDRVVLSDDQRRVVRDATAESCTEKAWLLHAINVRTNHVHVVVSAPLAPEDVMVTLKKRATYALRRAGLASPDIRPWSRHGSTRHLWNDEDLRLACVYALDAQ